jgi:hypothetical protein
MIHSIITLSMMPLGIMPLSVTIKNATLTITAHNVVMLSIAYAE